MAILYVLYVGSGFKMTLIRQLKSDSLSYKKKYIILIVTAFTPAAIARRDQNEYIIL